MWLTEKQVQELTKKKRPSAQIRVLVEAGVPFQVIAGRPIVVASDLKSRDEKRPRW